MGDGGFYTSNTYPSSSSSIKSMGRRARGNLQGGRRSMLGYEEEEDGEGESSSSSTDSNHNQMTGCSSSSSLSTDLRLGLTMSNSHRFFPSTSSSSRKDYIDWPPIKPQMKCAMMEAGKSRSNHADYGGENSSLFVKVYMEGIPIGRKVDLMTVHNYHSLLASLSHMFNTSVYCHDVNYQRISEGDHVLTYEDHDGDWMLVGDVPWEMFLSTVKKLRITKAEETC